MKWVIWGLLFVNFSLLGFFQASGFIKQQEPDTGTEAVKPVENAIKVLSNEELTAMPKRAPEPPVVAPSVSVLTCYEWGSFAAADAVRAQTALKKLGLSAITQSQEKSSPEKTRYWVYIPAQKTLSLAQAKLDELKTLGVAEALIIQDPKWRNAISLGMFKDEKLANDFLEKLRGMGVKSAVKAKRRQGSKETNLIINDVSPEQAQKLTELKPHFSRGELSTIDCK